MLPRVTTYQWVDAIVQQDVPVKCRPRVEKLAYSVSTFISHKTTGLTGKLEETRTYTKSILKTCKYI